MDKLTLRRFTGFGLYSIWTISSLDMSRSLEFSDESLIMHIQVKIATLVQIVTETLANNLRVIIFSNVLLYEVIRK